MLINDKSKRIVKFVKQHKLYREFRLLLQSIYRDADRNKECGQKFNSPKGSLYYDFMNAVKNENYVKLTEILTFIKQKYHPKSEIELHNFKTIFLYKPKRI